MSGLDHCVADWCLTPQWHYQNTTSLLSATDTCPPTPLIVRSSRPHLKCVTAMKRRVICGPLRLAPGRVRRLTQACPMEREAVVHH